MYESHFGFHRQPFQCAELTRAFFVSQSIQTILPQLLHALRSDLGIAVLTGPAGVGKTSFLKHLQTMLATEGRAIVCSGASLETPLNVLQTLHTALHGRAAQRASIDSVAKDMSQSRWTLLDQLQKTSELWGPILLLVDDAQLLPVSVLNELRAFTEEEWNGRSLVRCLIAGPLSLEEELARPTHADFSHRIRCHAFLQPLTSRESLEMLSRHLEVVGGQLSKVFTSKALELIAVACDGLPRCLSLLADESLVVAAERKAHVADDVCVRTALGRLQHLPYPWSASPHLPDDDHEVAIETTSNIEPTIQASSVPPAAAVSTAGSTPRSAFIEFGGPTIASGVLEVGSQSSRPSAPSAASSDIKAFSVGMSSVSQVAAAAIELGSFEVGRRFIQESADVVEAPIEVEELSASSSSGSDDSFDMNSGYGVSWESLEDSFAVTEFSKPYASASDDAGDTATPTPAPATDSASVVFTSTSDVHDAIVSSVSELTERSDDRWLAASTGAGFLQRLPVFDRYTWVALGREVPAGTYSVRSSSAANRVAYDDAVSMTPGTRTARSRAFDAIGLIDTTAAEIDRRLVTINGASELGEFTVSRPADHLASEEDSLAVMLATDESSSVPAIGVEFFNPPENHAIRPEANETTFAGPVQSDENRRAIRDAILSRLSQVDSLRERSDIEDLVDSAMASFGASPAIAQPADSHWLDGQLVFGKPQQQPDETDASTMTGDMEHGTGGAESARDEDNVDEISSSGRGTFFTLPSDVNAISWDLRSEVIESDDFLPLAESLSELQNEVSSFHQNLRRDDNDWRMTDRSSDVGLSDREDSLVAQARRRLDEAELNHLSAADSMSPGSGNSSGPTVSSFRSPAEESHTSAQAEVKAPAVFGQLFTRLRQLRKASGEN